MAFPYTIIDSHNHIYPARVAGKAVGNIGDFYTIPMYGKGHSEDLLANGSRIGVKKYVVHSVATDPAQVQSINNFIAREVEAHPEFIGFATLHPLMDDVEGEIERALALGLRGIKLHHDFQEFDIDSKESLMLYEKIGSELPIVLHTGDPLRDFSAPHRLAKVLDIFPEHTFIAAHFGGYTRWDEARECLLGKNCYIDTSSALFLLSPEEAVSMIRQHGADKVLFGTDYPAFTHEHELERFMKLPLTEEERRLILSENAIKLLDISLS